MYLRMRKREIGKFFNFGIPLKFSSKKYWSEKYLRQFVLEQEKSTNILFSDINLPSMTQNYFIILKMKSWG